MPQPLDDLGEENIAIVRGMLKAVVDYPQFHVNRFQIQRHGQARSNRHEPTFEYFVGLKRGATASPTIHQFTSTMNLGKLLVGRGFAVADRNDSWFNFTDDAMDWYRRPEPISDQQIQSLLGLFLLNQFHEYNDPLNLRPIAFDRLADEMRVPLPRLLSNARLLLHMGFVKEGLVVGESLDEGYIMLTDQKGLPWANYGAGPISPDGTPILNLTVNITLHQVIEQVESLDLPQETKDRAELILRRFDDEAKKSRPSYKPLQDLLDMAGNVKEVAPSFIRFMAEHLDDIERMARNLVG